MRSLLHSRDSSFYDDEALDYRFEKIQDRGYSFRGLGDSSFMENLKLINDAGEMLSLHAKKIVVNEFKQFMVFQAYDLLEGDDYDRVRAIKRPLYTKYDAEGKALPVYESTQKCPYIINQVWLFLVTHYDDIYTNFCVKLWGGYIIHPDPTFLQDSSFEKSKFDDNKWSLYLNEAQISSLYCSQNQNWYPPLHDYIQEQLDTFEGDKLSNIDGIVDKANYCYSYAQNLVLEDDIDALISLDTSFNIKKIKNYEISQIFMKMINCEFPGHFMKNISSDDETRIKMLLEYIKWLALYSTYTNMLVPPVLVINVWKLHIQYHSHYQSFLKNLDLEIMHLDKFYVCPSSVLKTKEIYQDVYGHELNLKFDNKKTYPVNVFNMIMFEVQLNFYHSSGTITQNDKSWLKVKIDPSLLNEQDSDQEERFLSRISVDRFHRRPLFSHRIDRNFRSKMSRYNRIPRPFRYKKSISKAMIKKSFTIKHNSVRESEDEIDNMKACENGDTAVIYTGGLKFCRSKFYDELDSDMYEKQINLIEFMEYDIGNFKHEFLYMLKNIVQYFKDSPDLTWNSLTAISVQKDASDCLDMEMYDEYDDM